MPSDSLTASEFSACLAEAAQGVAPENLPVQTTISRLTTNRKALLDLKAQGFSPAQIVTFLKHPRIGIDVSVVTLRKVLHTHKRTRGTKTPDAPLKYKATIALDSPVAK